MKDAEKLGRIKARIQMIQKERRKSKGKRVVGLIGSCLRDIEAMVEDVDAIYALRKEVEDAPSVTGQEKG